MALSGSETDYDFFSNGLTKASSATDSPDTSMRDSNAPAVAVGDAAEGLQALLRGQPVTPPRALVTTVQRAKIALSVTAERPAGTRKPGWSHEIGFNNHLTQRCGSQLK